MGPCPLLVAVLIVCCQSAALFCPGVNRLVHAYRTPGARTFGTFRAPDPWIAGAESCQVQVYLAANLTLSARLEFTDGCADYARALNSVTTRW